MTTSYTELAKKRDIEKLTERRKIQEKIENIEQ